MKNKSKSNEIAEEDLEKAAGGVVGKLIFADGSIGYQAMSSLEECEADEEELPWATSFDLAVVEDPALFKNREDAEKYAIEKGWGTDFHILRQKIMGWGGKLRFWDYE